MLYSLKIQEIDKPDHSSQSVQVQGHQQEHRSSQNASLFSSVFNLTNSAVGSGILAFPFAFARVGLSLGLGLTAALAVFSGLTLMIIAVAAAHTDGKSFQSVVERLCGKIWSYLIQLILLIYAFGACISFLVVLGEVASPALKYWSRNHWMSNPKVIIAIFAVCIMSPLAFMKSLGWLGFTSLVAIMSISYTVGLVIVMGALHISSVGIAPDVVYSGRFSLDIISMIPLFCFAFQCHIHATPIYYELKNKSLLRMGLIISLSMLICFILYSLVGVFGYLTFGGALKGNIMSYYDLKNPWVSIGLLSIAITVALSFPVYSFTARATIESLFFGNKALEGTNYILVTSFLLIFCIGLALIIPSILIIFGLMGAIGASSLMFVFPGLLWWKMTDTKLQKFFALILFLFGIVLSVVGTVFTIVDLVQPR